MNKRTGYSAAQSKISVGSALALFAGTGLLVASALTATSPLKNSNISARVKIQPQAWSYLSSLQLGVERASFADEVELGLDEETFPTEATRVAFAKPLVVRRKAVKHRKVVVTEPMILVHSEPEPIVPVSVTIHDHVSATQAAAAQVFADQVASEAQLESFRSMHRQLRDQFYVSMGGQGENPVFGQVTTQSAPVIEGSVQVVPSFEDPQVAEEAMAIEAALEAKAAAKARRAKAKSALAAPTHALQMEVDTIHEVASEPALSGTYASSALEPVRSLTNEITRTLNNATVGEANGDYSQFESDTAKTYRQISDLSASIFGASAAVTTHGSSSATAVDTLSAATQATAAGADYSHRAEYSTIDLFNMWKSWKGTTRPAPVQVTTQGPAAQALPPAPPANTLAMAEKPLIDQFSTLKTQQDDTANDADPGIVPSVPLYVEAFQWSIEVKDAYPKAITLEGWNEVRAADHWPVIHWNPDGHSQAPLISYNTAVMLAHFADTEIQKDAAIVFGKIPAGWDVEFSDRAEKVVYLNELNKAEATSENARYFAFINASPGAQVVTLKSVLGAETAAIVVPVMNGTSTYVDMASVSKRTFSGYVLDANASARKGIAGATVQVVGQPSAVFFTTESGYFHLSEVFAVGDYPVFAETVTTTGFKHRYRVTPNRMDGIDLFRMDDEQINTWLSQLEGGVSPESGLIVSAMPGLIQSYGDGRLFPTTHSLLENRALTPETYTLTVDGELEAGAPLEATAPRYVSVQVPSGAVVSQVEDNNRAVVWSQLVFAQPGVINVIGPY